MPIGRLLRPVRSTAARSPLAATAFEAPTTLALTSPAFADGAPIPRRHAGEGVGDDVSPALSWHGAPPDTAALLLLLDDVDVPLPKPLFHCGAALRPDAAGLGEGEFRTGTTGVRILTTMLSKDGYSGPRPIPGHGPHHYRFHLLALDHPVPPEITSVKAALAAAAGHVLARGTLIGTYQR
jgi:phosphatidylethanolamine-binding protein (PEBP) family uncharacterized protein